MNGGLLKKSSASKRSKQNASLKRSKPSKSLVHEPTFMSSNGQVGQTQHDGFYSMGPAVGISPAIQAKLTIGKPNDHYEREADNVADHVVSGRPAPAISSIAPQGMNSISKMEDDRAEDSETQPKELNQTGAENSVESDGHSLASNPIQKVSSEPDKENQSEDIYSGANEVLQPKTIQAQTDEVDEKNSDDSSTTSIRKKESRESPVSSKPNTNSLAAALNQSGKGNPVDPTVKNAMETSTGQNFNSVGVHSDTASHNANREIGARAFTHGSDVWLGQGESQNDAHLMAHELTHVVQQNAGVQSTQMIQQKQSDSSLDVDSRDRELDEVTSGASNKTDKNLRSPDQNEGSVAQNSVTSSAEDEAASVLPAKYQSNAVLDQELVDATSNSSAKAKKTPGRPTVLELDQSAPSQPETQPIPSQLPPEAAQMTSAPEPQNSLTQTQDNVGDITSELLPNNIDGLNSNSEAAASAPADVQEEETGEGATDQTTEETQGSEDGELASGESSQSGGSLASGPSAAGGPVIGAEAGASMVPAPQPEVLEAQLPARPITQDEFIEVAESNSSEEQDRAEVNRMLSGLRAEAELEKQQIGTEVQTRRAEILQARDSEIATINMTVDTQVSAITTLFTGARANLQQTFEANRALLESEADGDIDQIETDTSSRISEVESNLSQRQSDLLTYADEQSQRPPEIAQEEADRADSELETAASEAEAAGQAEARKHTGSDDPKPDQRSAARQVGRESASDIRSKKSDIRADLESRADGFSGRYFEYAETVNGQITDAGAQLIPSLQQGAESAKVSVQDGKQAALQAMERRLEADIQAFTAAETAAVSKLRAGGAKATSGIRKKASSAIGELEAGSSALILEIDNNLDEVSSVVAAEQEPFVPGARDMIDASRASIKETSIKGRSQLGTATTKGVEALRGMSATYASSAQEVVVTAQTTAQSIQDNASSSQQQTIDSRREAAQEAIAALASDQEGVISDLLSEIDSSIEEARGEIRGINDQFRTDIRAAADESIQEAIKPRTDDTETRAQEAASQAGESWLDGLLSAVGQIVIGLVIMVAVALVVAAIAAAFSVVITAWTAIMIAGAILLAVGLVMSIINRAGQWDQFEGSGPTRVAKIVGLAVMDTVGATGITEGFTGTDIVSGRELSDAEQTERGVMGWFTAVTLVLGARAAVKGPPGGAFVRPGSLRPSGIRSFFQGWRGWRLGGLKGIKSARLVLGEMYLGMRQGASNIREWVRTKVLRQEPTRLPPELVEQIGNITDAKTRVGGPEPYAERGAVGELPYEMPPDTQVVRPGEPLDVSALDPNKTYLWNTDPQGNIILSPEHQGGFAPTRTRGGRSTAGTVKHGDLTPGVGGQYRGASRGGGELIFRDGQWFINHESSYAFARMDGERLGNANLDAVIDALGRTGTDTTGIAPDYSYSVPEAPPVRRGAGPGRLPATPTPRDQNNDNSDSE